MADRQETSKDLCRFDWPPHRYNKERTHTLRKRNNHDKQHNETEPDVATTTDENHPIRNSNATKPRNNYRTRATCPINNGKHVRTTRAHTPHTHTHTHTHAHTHTHTHTHTYNQTHTHTRKHVAHPTSHANGQQCNAHNRGCNKMRRTDKQT